MIFHGDYRLEWNDVDEEKLMKLLVEEHDFSEERIKKALSKLNKKSDIRKQKGLGDWIK